MGLDRKYVGDGYASCSDFPRDTFLRKGAKYRLLGTVPVPELQENRSITKLPRSSHLRTLLCQSVGEKCSFPGVIVLDSNIQCTGIECDVVDTRLHVVEVKNDVYYEYVRPSCVHFDSIATPITNSFILVNPDGKVAIERQDSTLKTHHSHTFFRVDWKDNLYPHVSDNSCLGGNCEIAGPRCRCEVAVENAKHFTSTPTRKMVLSELHIGGIPEAFMDDHNVTYSDENRISIYDTEETDMSKPGISTIFGVTDDFGRKLHFKNMKSRLVIVNSTHINETVSTSPFEFRNPPSFYGVNKEVR